MTERYEFSVWVFLPDDWHFPVVRFTDATSAMVMAGLASRLDYAERVSITDGDDYTVFEWRRGEGVTWPPPGEAKDG